MTVALDNSGKTGKSGEPWCKCNWMSFTRPFLLGPVFFRTARPCSGGYHMERGGMQLHDVVGINCKKGTTTENQGSAVKYMGSGVYLDDCVCVLSDLTWLPLLGVGRKSWYIIILPVPYVSLQITRRVLVAPRYAYAPYRCRTHSTGGPLFPSSVPVERFCWHCIRWCGTGRFQEQGQCLP